MSTLTCIGKGAVVSHYKEILLHLLMENSAPASGKRHFSVEIEKHYFRFVMSKDGILQRSVLYWHPVVKVERSLGDGCSWSGAALPSEPTLVEELA